MRIAGVTIPENKRLEIALTAIYGVGRSRAHEILQKAEVDLGKKVGQVTEEEEARIRSVVESGEFLIEGDLKRQISAHIKHLKDVHCYRGMRHLRGLPVRGQRTKTNARTRKGPKKTMGSGKRKVEKK